MQNLNLTINLYSKEGKTAIFKRVVLIIRRIKTNFFQIGKR